MNPTYQVNQVGEAQPDADDSTVPISSLRRTSSQLFSSRSASRKMGTLTVRKQGDTSRLYTNLRREALWRANQAGLLQQDAKTTMQRSDKVGEFANARLLSGFVLRVGLQTNIGASHGVAASAQT